MSTYVSVTITSDIRPTHVGPAGGPDIWHSVSRDAPAACIQVAPEVAVSGTTVDLVAWATEVLRLADECSDAADDLEVVS
jgi:hypothetical protein